MAIYQIKKHRLFYISKHSFIQSFNFYGNDKNTAIYLPPSNKWRVVRVVEGARLESVYTGNCIKSSNLLLSAKYYTKRFKTLQSL